MLLEDAGFEAEACDDGEAALVRVLAQPFDLIVSGLQNKGLSGFDLTMAVRVVDSLDEAVEHVTRYGSGHSEAIVTRSLEAAREFEAGIDAACIYINASTRFTDGGEFGMGAEIANSTQKLHARGPIGLRELTSMKYVITGDGHVRT